MTQEAPKPVSKEQAVALFREAQEAVSKIKIQPTPTLPAYERAFKHVNGYLPPAPPTEDQEPDF